MRVKLSELAQAIMWMVVATGGLVISDSIAKLLLQSFSIPQVVWARYAAHFVIVVLLLGNRAPLGLRTQNLSLQLSRSLCLILATISLYAAIRTNPLATASAIMFSAPIMVTALSGPLLKERVGIHRWFGVILGFCGVLAIIKPSGDDWQPRLLWAVLAAFLYALYQIMTRALNRMDGTETTILYTSLVGAVTMSCVVPFVWVAPNSGDIVWMALTGILSGSAHYAIIKALSSTPASVVTPIGYTNLIWAAGLGYVLFAEVPDARTFVGAGIIVLSGAYIFRDEIRRTAS